MYVMHRVMTWYNDIGGNSSVQFVHNNDLAICIVMLILNELGSWQLVCYVHHVL